MVFAAFLLDLSDTLGVTTTALLAVATWVATVLIADRMRRRDERGPFETLVRRVTYAGDDEPMARPRRARVSDIHDLAMSRCPAPPARRAAAASTR